MFSPAKVLGVELTFASGYGGQDWPSVGGGHHSPAGGSSLLLQTSTFLVYYSALQDMCLCLYTAVCPKSWMFWSVCPPQVCMCPCLLLFYKLLRVCLAFGYFLELNAIFPLYFQVIFFLQNSYHGFVSFVQFLSHILYCAHRRTDSSIITLLPNSYF